MTTDAAQRVPIPSRLPSTFATNFRNQLESKLLHAPSNPIGRLQSTLAESLQTSGWGDEIETFVDTRLRGEYSSPDDAGSSGGGKRQLEASESDGFQSTTKRRRILRTPNAQATLREDVLTEVAGASRPDGGAQSTEQQRAVDGDVSDNQGSHSMVLQRQRDRLRVPAQVVEAAVNVLKEELRTICYVDDDAYLDLRLA